MNSPLKWSEPQLLSLFCLVLFSFYFLSPKNTIFGIPLDCAPKSNLKLIHLSSSQADSPSSASVLCAAPMKNFSELLMTLSCFFDTAHTLLGHVKLCMPLPLLHFFQGIGKILAQIYGTVYHPMYYFLCGLWHLVLYIFLDPGILSWNISRLFLLPMESKHCPPFINFTVARILLGRFWLLCLGRILGLLQFLCQSFVPTCELVSSSLGGFISSHTPWNFKTLSCIRTWANSSILFVLWI